MNNCGSCKHYTSSAPMIGFCALHNTQTLTWEICDNHMTMPWYSFLKIPDKYNVFHWLELLRVFVKDRFSRKYMLVCPWKKDVREKVHAITFVFVLVCIIIAILTTSTAKGQSRDLERRIDRLETDTGLLRSQIADMRTDVSVMRSVAERDQANHSNQQNWLYGIAGGLVINFLSRFIKVKAKEEEEE